jgi:hypothetical protein
MAVDVEKGGACQLVAWLGSYLFTYIRSIAKVTLLGMFHNMCSPETLLHLLTLVPAMSYSSH